MGSNLVSSYTRWKWCQSHARSIKVPNPGKFNTVFDKRENTGGQIGHTKKYLKKIHSKNLPDTLCADIYFAPFLMRRKHS